MISQKLAVAIEYWLEEKPERRSLSMLARLSGVSYSTVRRIMQKETEPTFDVALPLCDIVMNKTELESFLQENFPRFAEVIKDLHFQNKIPDDLRDYFGSIEHFPLLALISTARGISYQEIHAILGSSGADNLDELVTAGVVIENNRRFYLAQDDIGVPDMDLARRQISMLVDLCRKKNDHIPGASGAHIIGNGVNEQGVERLHELVVDFLRSVNKVMQDERYQGSISWIGGWVHQVLKGEEKLK